MPNQARDWVVLLLQRLQATHPSITLPELAQALSDAGDLVGRDGVLYLGSVRDYLAQHRQQVLIDRVVTWGTRTLGPSCTYKDIYDDYCRQARELGLEPLKWKTFRNRAGGRVPWGPVLNRHQAEVTA